MAEKSKPQAKPAGTRLVNNGQVKDAPTTVKTAVLAPPATKPKK